MAVPTIKKYNASDLPLINEVLTSFSSVEQKDKRDQSIFISPSGVFQAVESSQYTARIWLIQAFLLSNTEKNNFISFREGRNVQILPFKWIDDADSVRKFVRFNSDEIRYQRISVTAWSAEFEIREAHPLEINDNEV